MSVYRHLYRGEANVDLTRSQSMFSFNVDNTI